MKKNALTIIFTILLGLASVNAQEVFNEGDTQFNLGIGLGDLYLDSYSIGLIPSINFSGEYGTIPTGEIGLVSFGGITAFHYAPYYYDDTWEETTGHNIIFAIQGRAAWHLHVFNSDKWDVYAGLGTGIRINNWSRETTYTYSNVIETNGETNSDFIISEFVGGRMMFNESFGLFAELGYDATSTMKFGITFKM